MPREYQQDGEVAFGGFASYPNPTSLDPQKGVLTAINNMRIVEGVMTPRDGSTLVESIGSGITPPSPFAAISPFTSAGSGDGTVDYAASACTSNGDFIYIWSQGVVKRYCTTTPAGITTVTASTRPYRAIRGQGYQGLATIEASSAANWTGEYDFTACTNVLGRLAYAKNDQVWLTLFGGLQPFNGDTISLIQGTYDSIKALHYSNQSRKLYAFGNRSAYELTFGLPSMSLEAGKPSADFFHKVNLLTGQEGILAKDSVAEVAGFIFYLGHDGIYQIDAQKGMVEGQGPMSNPIEDVLKSAPAAEMQKAVGVSWMGRYYLLLPNSTDYMRNRILVINPKIPNVFESIDTYDFEMVSIMTARDPNGVLWLWAVTPDGRIIKLESGSSDLGLPYQSSFKTRNYNFRTDFDKRYDACTLSLDTKGPANVEFYQNTVNPDSRLLIDQFNGNVGQAVRRALAGKKCTGLVLEVVVKSGKPLFYSCTVDGSISGRSIFNVF